MCLWRNIRDLDDIFTSVIVKQEGKVRYEERISGLNQKLPECNMVKKKKELRIKIYTVAFHIKWPCRETTEQTYNIIQLPRWTATYFITLKYIPVFKNVVNSNIILNKYIYLSFSHQKETRTQKLCIFSTWFHIATFLKTDVYIYIFFFINIFKQKPATTWAIRSIRYNRCS